MEKVSFTESLGITIIIQITAELIEQKVARQCSTQKGATAHTPELQDTRELSREYSKEQRTTNRLQG